MGALANICSQWNVKHFLLLLTAFTVVTVCWYVANLPATDSGRHKAERDCVGRYNLESANKMELEPMDDSISLEPYEPLFQDKIVHLDLKGAPPKISYLAEVFPLIAKLGATGVLVEYEDMFPYGGGPLHGLPALNAYTSAVVASINQLAKESNLEIIPLVQTFGHLEFLLKLPEHAHLREVPEHPQAICPSHNETLPLLFLMLGQVAKLHPQSKRIHIGADEVYFIGRCNACQERMSSQLWSTADLFMSHVTAVATYVNEHLHLRPMMWDDEFRSFSETQLLQSGIGRLVDVVVWNYKPTLELSQEVWAKYLNTFDAIYVASAFKGATGSDQQITSVRYHVENHRAWMKLVSEYRDTVHFSKFKGIMLTGWSRYDHFSVLCELLPAAIPSLAFDLLLLKYGGNAQQQQTVDQEVSKLLDCSGSLLMQQQMEGYYIHCKFPGSEVFSLIQNYASMRFQYAKLLNNSVLFGWLNDYNIAKEFSSPMHLEGIGVDMGFLQSSLESLSRDSLTAFQSVYEQTTVTEWLETHVQPIANHIKKLLDAVELLRSKKTWPRRPL